MAVTVTTSVPNGTDVLRIAAAIERNDGAPPLSDQTVSQLSSAAVTHLLAHDAGRLVGYAQLDPADDGEPDEVGSLEVAALEAAAVEALLDAAGTPVLAWSHGRHSRLIPVFERRAFTRERELHQLRRPLDGDLAPDPPLGNDITVRAFVPGVDNAAWLALNAAAFAYHPEQGRWTDADLRGRITDEWFDPAGFLLAERDGALLAFHWTKVHPDGLGEVYVLGVSPDAQGLGLGGALLIRGLRYLADVRHCPAVLLYVDGDNPTALHLYERDGFSRYDLDIQWRST